MPTSAIDGDFTEWSAGKLKNIIGELTGHIDSHIRFFSTQLSEILNIVEPIRTAPELIEHYLPDVVKRAQIEKIQIMVTKLNEIHDTTVKKAKKLSYIK